MVNPSVFVWAIVLSLLPAGCVLGVSCTVWNNRTYREQVPDAHGFDAIDQVREVSQLWVEDYNNTRPHEALGGLLPHMYRQQNQTTTLAINEVIDYF
ncbi:integrase core domain-containing protein [Rhodoflexus sp.]